MINRKIGESISITGGAEITPKVSVVRYFGPGSMHSGNRAFEITQETLRGSMQTVLLSEETMQAILNWGKDEANVVR